MIVKIRDTCDIFPDNVKFYVYGFTNFNIAEISVGQCIRDDCHLKSVVRRVADCQ